MKGQNLFFLFLILIAVAGMFLFFNSGASYNYIGLNQVSSGQGYYCGIAQECSALKSCVEQSCNHYCVITGDADSCYAELELQDGTILSSNDYRRAPAGKNQDNTACFLNTRGDLSAPAKDIKVCFATVAGVDAKEKFNMIFNPVPQPPVQRIPNFSDLISQIIDWIKETFESLKRVFAFSIAGETKVTPGTLNSYVINLASPYALQEDYLQGVYMQRWCSVALIDKTEKIINELPFEICKTDWTKTYTVLMPQGSFTDFAIISVMVETRQDFVNGAWVSTYQNKVINKESLSLSSKVIIPPTQATIPSGLKAIWDSISQFLANIWKGLFG